MHRTLNSSLHSLFQRQMNLGDSSPRYWVGGWEWERERLIKSKTSTTINEKLDKALYIAFMVRFKGGKTPKKKKMTIVNPGKKFPSTRSLLLHPQPFYVRVATLNWTYLSTITVNYTVLPFRGKKEKSTKMALYIMLLVLGRRRAPVLARENRGSLLSHLIQNLTVFQTSLTDGLSSCRLERQYLCQHMLEYEWMTYKHTVNLHDKLFHGHVAW